MSSMELTLCMDLYLTKFSHFRSYSFDITKFIIQVVRMHETENNRYNSFTTRVGEANLMLVSQNE